MPKWIKDRCEVEPYVLDRTASVDGIELRCRAHNAYEATLYFGPWPGGLKEPLAASGSRSGPGTRSGTSNAERAQGG